MKIPPILGSIIDDSKKKSLLLKPDNPNFRMEVQKNYNFTPAQFDDDGKNASGQLFSEIIGSWEQDFHKEFAPYFASHLYANAATLNILKRCHTETDLYDFGMDGDMDLDTNLEIESHSARNTVYAIGSKISGNADEPIFLTMVNMIPNGIAILKYQPDDDNGDDPEDDPLPEGEVLYSSIVGIQM